MTQEGRLLASAFRFDALANCLRAADVFEPKARLTVTLEGAMLELSPDRTVPLPAGTGPDAELGLKLTVGRRQPWVWEGKLHELRDATPAVVRVSHPDYDALRGLLKLRGWTGGIPASARIALFRRGEKVAEGRCNVRRPDVRNVFPLLLLDCGFIFATSIEGADRESQLELRATDAQGRLLATALVPMPDVPAEAGPPLQPRLEAKAASMPRARLEWLIASDAFRRRWQGGVSEGLPPDGPFWLAREVVARALAASLAEGEEIAVRLVDGDLVRCAPVDDPQLARAYLLHGHDELGFLRWLATEVGPGRAAIDGGAAYGVMSRTMARSGARVIAVEADAVSAARLRWGGLDAPSGSIELVEAALAAAPGTVTFAGMGGSLAGGGKVLSDASPERIAAFLAEVAPLGQVSLTGSAAQGTERRSFTAADVKVREVPAVTLDEICERFSLSDVALVKLDIEGGELEALRGAARLLSGGFGRPPVVAFEYSDLFPTRGGERRELLEMLWREGYSLWRLKDGKRGGGALLPVPTADDAPPHDNLIAMPPGRTPEQQGQ